MRLIAILFFLLIPQLLLAQYPSYSLYPVNPLLINPAFAGMHGRSEISLNHRQQWLGIDNAPSVSTFSFDKAVAPTISLGLQARRVSQGAINTNTAHLLFAYRALLGQRTSLNFGLAGGIISSGLNKQSTYNPSDLAVISLMQNAIRPDLRFGTNFHIRGLNVGISFTELLQNRPFGSDISDASDFSFHESYIVNFDYKIHFNSIPFQLQPFGQYYHDKYAAGYFEGGTLLHYDELLYLGGLYRQDYGLGFLAGINFKDFSVNYGYELATAMVNNIGQGSHELQLSLRFGEKVNTRSKEAPLIVSATPTTEDSLVNTPIDEKKSLSSEIENHDFKEADFEEIETVKTEEIRVEEPAHAIYHQGAHPKELPIGFYIIAGAFKELINAQKIATKISQNGVFASTGYNSERKVYFVYIYRSDKLDKTRTARDEFRKKAMLKDAWLLEIRNR